MNADPQLCFKKASGLTCAKWPLHMLSWQPSSRWASCSGPAWTCPAQCPLPEVPACPFNKLHFRLKQGSTVPTICCIDDQNDQWDLTENTALIPWQAFFLHSLQFIPYGTYLKCTFFRESSYPRFITNVNSIKFWINDAHHQIASVIQQLWVSRSPFRKRIFRIPVGTDSDTPNTDLVLDPHR